MASPTNSETTFNLILNVEVKELVQQAATHLGKSVHEFASASLADAARQVLDEPGVTVLSNRDWELFCSLLDATDLRPNDALLKAARRYKEEIG